MIDGFLRGNFPNTTSWSVWAKEILLVVAGLLTITNGIVCAVYVVATFVLATTGLLGPAPVLAYMTVLILILFFGLLTVAFANIFGRVRKEIKNENS